MMILLTRGADSYAQFVAVLVIFVLVLFVTAAVTKWIAGYQKQQNAAVNVEIIEMTRIAANKYIQIVRIGKTYVALAVCKDGVTRLCEIPEEQLRQGGLRQSGPFSYAGFRDLLDRAVKRGAADSPGAGDSQSDEED